MLSFNTKLYSYVRDKEHVVPTVLKEFCQNFLSPPRDSSEARARTMCTDNVVQSAVEATIHSSGCSKRLTFKLHAQGVTNILLTIDIHLFCKLQQIIDGLRTQKC